MLTNSDLQCFSKQLRDFASLSLLECIASLQAGSRNGTGLGQTGKIYL